MRVFTVITVVKVVKVVRVIRVIKVIRVIGVIGVAILMATIGRPASAAEPMALAPATVTIRIYDYAQTRPDLLLRAQQRVADVYDGIGVRTEWAETERPSEWLGLGPHGPHNASELMVVILSPLMASRRIEPQNVLGLAVGDATARGHVAYVLSDRVQRTANACDWDPMDLMGIVMAHELAHLLLPYGSHSPEGLMRAHWDIAALRATHRGQLMFTAPQADVIRRTLWARTPPVS